MTDMVKVFLTFVEWTRVDHFTFCEENKLIEESCNIGSRLMDCKDDSTIEISC